MNTIKAKQITRIEIYKGVFSYKISSLHSSDKFTQFVGFFPNKEMFDLFKEKAIELIVAFNDKNQHGMYCDVNFSAYRFETSELDFEYFETLEDAMKSFNVYKLF